MFLAPNRIPASQRLRTRLAEYVLRLATSQAPVDVALPDGSLLNRAGPNHPGPETRSRPRIVLHRPKEVFRRMAQNPKIGIGESYTAGDWSADDGSDLADVLAPTPNDSLSWSRVGWYGCVTWSTSPFPQTSTVRLHTPATTSLPTTIWATRCSPRSSIPA